MFKAIGSIFKDPDAERKRDDYKVVRKLGEGSYGVVKEVTHIPSGRNFAMKSIAKKKVQNEKALRVVKREMSILHDLEPHPNVISMFDHFETRDKYYLVFEIATGGELFERISAKGRFTERDAAEIVFQLLDGISYLHAHGIVHRDLKPENILYKTPEEDSDVVIADFGVANHVNDNEMLKTLCGSPAYAAPEVIRRTGHSFPADIWSVGVIAFTLLMGYGPWYYTQDLPSMFDAILNGGWRFESPYVDNVSDLGRKFIKRLMQQKPEKRPTARQAMIDPWLLRYSRRAKDHGAKVREVVRSNSGAKPTPATIAAATAAAIAGEAVVPPIPDDKPSRPPKVVIATKVSATLQSQNPDSPFVDPQGNLFPDVAALDLSAVLPHLDEPQPLDDTLPDLSVVPPPKMEPMQRFRRAATIIGRLKRMQLAAEDHNQSATLGIPEPLDSRAGSSFDLSEDERAQK